MTEAEAPARERDSLLAALELFRGLHLHRSVTTVILFLYVCENEGLNVSELAHASGLQVAGAARLVKMLAGEIAEEPIPPEAVLFSLKSSPDDKRLRFIHLSRRGRELRDEMERLIARAVPIRPAAALAAQ
jgi:hypothetical protein